jgi:retinol dehydrogenase-12
MATPPPSIASKLPSELKPSSPHAFDPTTAIPPQAGKVFLITGATSGIGRQTALELAAHGPTQLWISGRDVDKGNEVVAAIKDVSNEVDVRFIAMDLSSFDSVKLGAKEVLFGAKDGNLHVLMLNAGIVSVTFHPPHEFVF